MEQKESNWVNRISSSSNQDVVFPACQLWDQWSSHIYRKRRPYFAMLQNMAKRREQCFGNRYSFEIAKMPFTSTLHPWNYQANKMYNVFTNPFNEHQSPQERSKWKNWTENHLCKLFLIFLYDSFNEHPYSGFTNGFLFQNRSSNWWTMFHSRLN